MIFAFQPLSRLPSAGASTQVRTVPANTVYLSPAFLPAPAPRSGGTPGVVKSEGLGTSLTSSNSFLASGCIEKGRPVFSTLSRISLAWYFWAGEP